jgi:hypothetical protein
MQNQLRLVAQAGGFYQVPIAPGQVQLRFEQRAKTDGCAHSPGADIDRDSF